MILTIVAVPVVAIVAGLAWFGTIWTAYNYKWGWIEIPVHYRLSFGVEVGGVAYTGSTIVQVTYQQIPLWQDRISPGIAAIYRGQAAHLKLPDGKMVCLMPGAINLIYGKDYRSVAAIADRLLSVDGSPTGPKEKWVPIHASNAGSVTGTSDLPFDLIPPMIILDDPASPSSAHLFEPEHPEKTLGPASRFLGAQIAVTSEPVSHGIETVLPWLTDPAIPQMLNHPGDPFLQENHRNPLFKAFFY